MLLDNIFTGKKIAAHLREGGYAAGHLYHLYSILFVEFDCVICKIAYGS